MKCLGYLFAITSFAAVPAMAEKGENEAVSAKISGISFTTHDAESSAEFYTDFLGFTIRRDVELTASATLAVYGAAEGSTIRYIVLVPKGWPEENASHPGLSFAQIMSESNQSANMDPSRTPQTHETVLAYSVKNLSEIAKRMRNANVPVVVPFAPSATGKSNALTVLDPNGVRVQLYEIIQ